MTEFEKERDEAAEKYRLDVIEEFKGLPDNEHYAIRKYIGFKEGADWANARAEKRIQELVKALQYYAQPWADSERERSAFKARQALKEWRERK